MDKKCAGITKDVIDSFAVYLSEKGRSENTIKTYCGVIHTFSTWLETQGIDLTALTQEDVQRYIGYLESENRSVSTINKIYNTINTFAKSRNVPELTAQIKRSKTKIDYVAPEYLSEEEVTAILKKAKTDSNKRNKAILYVLLYTGVRVSELCTLNREDVKLNHKSQTGQVIVKHAESKNERIIPLSKELVHTLHDYLSSRYDEQEALFVSNYQKRIAARTVQHMLKEEYGVYPHKLRHTFCYDLVRKGVDLSIVAQLSGHSDINVTKQYLVDVDDQDHVG
ncbi:tyrosine-type recombinase/integrase [Alkalihalobacillus sp. MEB130]|uniref:tyrosine-type recombinase/integrase n=1 Tax=Alkalihalobacillus sp. MEB130 TaxID=2976704 RepID=UPI0028E09762|nr:tyrosine-type recombinase/integrase [Alkalihalobacillus sp. MEB130]MDT8862981.1 tyrosine-type recombinase/integrase [Alkalihalobacillus sp. MEB130]